MGNPLVRFWEGQELNRVWTRYCGTVAKAGGKRRKRTSSCSSGRLLPTRSQVWQATDTQLNQQVALKILPDAFAGRWCADSARWASSGRHVDHRDRRRVMISM